MGGPLGRHTGKRKWEVRAIMHLTGDSGIFVVKEAEEASLAFVLHCVLTLKGTFLQKSSHFGKIARIVFFFFVLQTCHEENSRDETSFVRQCKSIRFNCCSERSRPNYPLHPF